MEVGIWGMIGGVATTFATAATTWVFSRRQSSVEISKLQQEVETMRAQRENDVKTSELEIVERHAKLYNALVDDLGRQLLDLKKENATIREENAERLRVSDETRREISLLHHELAQVRAELNQMKIDFPCESCPRRS